MRAENRRVLRGTFRTCYSFRFNKRGLSPDYWYETHRPDGSGLDNSTPDSLNCVEL